MTDYVAEYIPLLNTIGHSAIQLVSALALGASLDYGAYLLLPQPAAGKHIQKWTDAALEAIEATAQVVIGSVLLGGVFNYLASLPTAAADPTNGQVFAAIFYQISQPGLMLRLGRVMEYVREAVLRPESDLVARFNGAFRTNSVVGTPADSSEKHRITVLRQNGFSSPDINDVHAPSNKKALQGPIMSPLRVYTQ